MDDLEAARICCCTIFLYKAGDLVITETENCTKYANCTMHSGLKDKRH